MAFRRMWEGADLSVSGSEDSLLSNAIDLKRYLGYGYENAFFVLRQHKAESYYDEEQMKKESEFGYALFTDKKSSNGFTKRKKMRLQRQKKSRQKHSVLTFPGCGTGICWKRKKPLANNTWRSTESSMFRSRNVLKNSMKSLGANFQKPQKTRWRHSLNFHALQSQVLSYGNSWTKKRMFADFLLGQEKDLLIKMHLGQYSFLYSAEGFGPATKQKILEEFFASKKKIFEYETEIKKMLSYYGEIKERQFELTSENNLSEQIVSMFRVLRHFGNSRLEARDAWVSLAFAMRAYSRELCKRFGLPEDGLRDYLSEEMKRLFETGERVPEEVLRQRFEFSIVALMGGKVVALSGEDAKKFYCKNVPKEEIPESVSGMVANRGKAQGIAKVLLFDENLVEEMRKMKQGQILVVGQTRPMLVPALKKAAAIVTDEGGITSHAAIVAREFRIPCIVGTHNATRVFKDGDLVEVDADNGTAKKIK